MYRKTSVKGESMKLSDEELVEDLKMVAKMLGKVPTQEKYIEYGKYSTTTFTNRKPWNKWLIEIFGKTNRKISWKNGNKISKKDLINNLIELNDKLGRIPQKDDLKHGKYGPSGYNRVFGGLTNALVEIGLKNPAPNKKEVIEDIKRIFKKIGRTPSLNDYYEHYSFKDSLPSIYYIFESWTKALLLADIPVMKPRNVSKQDVIDALEKRYKEHNKDCSCLEYWSIRKSDNFPYSCNTISDKFDNIPWENIMKTIDSNYQTTNQFVSRGLFLGKEGNIYLSSIERVSGDILYKLKKIGDIKDYEYEASVCEGKNWTCDFKITLSNDDILWLEIDGMRKNRKFPYSSGDNEKIEYYKQNGYNFYIVSYSDDVNKKLKNILKGGKL